MLAGTGALIGLILRRDRLKLPLIIASFVLFLLAMIPVLSDTYGDAESLTSLYATFNVNPAGLFMTGPMDQPTLAGLMTIETLIWWGLALAFINTMLVVRHTRHNEEIGAQELLLSGQVHRSSPLAAVLTVAVGVNAAIALGVGIGMSLESSWSTGSAWLYAVALGAFGVVWAAIASVVVQVVESGRAANGVLAGLIGISFVLRGIGDFMGSIDASGLHQAAWVSWFSPLGWLQATRPLTEPEWWPLLISVIVALLVTGLGFWLLGRRDLGSGLLPSRRGRSRASRWLGTTAGLAWRLQRNVMFGWLIGVLVMVVTIGVLVPQMNSVYEDSANMQQMIQAIGGAGALVPAFLSAMILIVSIMVYGYVVHALMRLRGEESNGSLESVLATKTSRLNWLGLHLVIVLLGGALMLGLTGWLLALIVNSTSDISVSVAEYATASMSYWPVVLFFAAGYVLLFGLWPRLVNGLMWLYFGLTAFIAWLGPVMGLPGWVTNLAITEHVAAPPVEAIDPAPLVTIVLVAVIFLAVGGLAWRRRDLAER